MSLVTHIPGPVKNAVLVVRIHADHENRVTISRNGVVLPFMPVHGSCGDHAQEFYRQPTAPWGPAGADFSVYADHQPGTRHDWANLEILWFVAWGQVGRGKADDYTFTERRALMPKEYGFANEEEMWSGLDSIGHKG